MGHGSTVEMVGDLFRKHDAAIRTLISRHVRCRHDAEDMYQDLYLRLVHRPPPHQTHILAYLNKVIRNHATDTARHMISRCGSVSRYAALCKYRTPDGEPESTLIQIEQTSRIIDVIESVLPPHIAQAILERHLYGRTVNETAVRLSVNERTVAHYCCTGLRKIRQLVEEGRIQMDIYEELFRKAVPCR